MVQLSEKMKYAIINYYEIGYNSQKIADLLKININTVYKWINRYKQTNEIERKSGSGRKTEITNEQILAVVNKIQINVFYSLEDIISKLKESNDISKYMVRQILEDSGYVYGLPPTRFPLTEEHKKMRLNFALTHVQIDWTKIVFTDETSCQENNYRVKRWYNPNNIYDHDILYKHCSKVNAWGAITYDDKEIYVFSEIMNADKYIEILDDYLMNVYQKDFYIIYDNDPKHTSKKAKKFLVENNFKTIDFPPYSPDLNPIENIWSILKRNIAKEHITTKIGLRKSIYRIWNAIDQHHIQNAIISMKDRLIKVIEAKGSYID